MEGKEGVGGRIELAVLGINTFPHPHPKNLALQCECIDCNLPPPTCTVQSTGFFFSHQCSKTLEGEKVSFPP